MVVEPRRPGVEYVVTHAPRPDGDVLLIVTNDGAREFRLMRTPVATPGREHWEELVGEDPEERLESADVFAHHVVLGLRRDGNPLLRIVRRDGSEVALDVHAGEEAAFIGLSRNEVYDTRSVLVRVESYTSPPPGTTSTWTRASGPCASSWRCRPTTRRRTSPSGSRSRRRTASWSR